MSDTTDITVIDCPSPFLSKRNQRVFLPGMTVQQILEKTDIPNGVSFVVTIDSVPVKPEDYANVIPAEGSCVTVRAVPTGGGGNKNPFRVILTVLVVVAAYVFAPYLAPYLTSLGLGASAAMGLSAMAIMSVGMLIVNAICPPAGMDLESFGGLSSSGSLSSGGSSSGAMKPSYALSGANNSMVPYGPIPMLLGRHRISPPYGARPYTTNEGDDQYLHCLFCEGNGLIFMVDHRFGETPIENFSDIEMEVFNGDSDENSTVFPGDVFQQDEAIVLKQVDGWVVRETQPNTNRVSIDITYPNGLIKLKDSGATQKLKSLVDIQYRLKGTEEWIGGIHTVEA